jgi:sugar phosphate isomerase/epimerase
MKLGAQLFSVRDRGRTPEEVRLCFEEMKRIGYTVVQVSGLCPTPAEQLKAFSEEFELPITLTHSPYDRIVNDTEALIAEHKIFGCPIIGIGSMPKEYRKTEEGLYAFIAEIKEPMRKMKEAGLKLAYHNHEFEFNTYYGTRRMIDILAEECPELDFTLDVAWVTIGGGDVEEYMRKFAKRITNLHLKDYPVLVEGQRPYPFCPCGEGLVDFDGIVRLARELGIKYCQVEQDNAPDSGDSFGQMAISYNNLKELF